MRPGKRGTPERLVSITQEPLGIMAIAAFVRKYSNHVVSIVDAQAESAQVQTHRDGHFRMGMSDESMRERIRSFAPRIVGISSLFELDELETLRLAQIVKSISKEIVVVIGGLDAGVRYREFLGSDSVDMVVRGDGEETFLDILEHLEGALPLTGVPGTCERLESGEVRKNAPRIPKVPFDEYPYPARDIVPPEHYYGLSVQKKAFPLSREYPRFLIQASRGCTLRCAFCDIVAVQDKWRAHSPEYVVNEMQYLIENYGAREFSFVDDNFMLRTKWVREIFEIILKRKLKVSIEIQPGTAVWALNEEIIDLMIDAGIYRVLLPVESGNPEIIKFIKKPVNLEKTVKMIDYCNRKGLYTHAHLIIGFPFETRDDMEKTFEWARTSGLDAVKYFVAEPMKGARMYPIYEENNWLSQENSSKRWRTEHFTLDELLQISELEGKKYLKRRILFYLNILNVIRYLVPKLSSFTKLRYFIRIAKFSLFDARMETNVTWRDSGATRTLSETG
jgi:radical SAM superfamily enzyme YgiQ (UPF0313 family)